MSAHPLTVLHHAVSPRLGTVHLEVRTDGGCGVLRLTRAVAKQLARELDQAADAGAGGNPTPLPTLAHIVAAAQGQPLFKPCGRLA